MNCISLWPNVNAHYSLSFYLSPAPALSVRQALESTAPANAKALGACILSVLSFPLLALVAACSGPVLLCKHWAGFGQQQPFVNSKMPLGRNLHHCFVFFQIFYTFASITCPLLFFLLKIKDL